MATCSFCGEEINDNDKFCGQCGKPAVTTDNNLNGQPSSGNVYQNTHSIPQPQYSYSPNQYNNQNYQEIGKGKGIMKVISILLIILGALGIFMGGLMFGDIGIACIVGALAALLSGIGFMLIAKRIENIENHMR